MNLILLLAGCALLTLRISEIALVRWSLTLATTLLATIVIGGYSLSAIGLLNSELGWNVYSALVLGIGVAINLTWKGLTPSMRCFRLRIETAGTAVAEEFQKLPKISQITISALVITFAITSSLNLISCLFLPPHNYDSMNYHLARVAYYLQHNSLGYYEASYWAQVTHPKNSAVLLLYSWITSGGNENIFQLVQYLAYWIAVVSVFGISRELGGNRLNSLSVALVFGLLTEVLMEATTTQKDLLIAACFALSVYFILVYKKNGTRCTFILSAVAFSLALGTNGSAILILPSILIIVIYSVFEPNVQYISRRLLDMIGKTFLWFSLAVVLALPTGYMEMLSKYGHPLGPAEVVTAHSAIAEAPWFIGGIANMTRFAIDFMALDGFHPSIPGVLLSQRVLKAVPVRLYSILGFGKGKEAMYARTIWGFGPNREPIAHEDMSFWGIMGFGLIWVAVITSLIKYRRNRGLAFFALSSVVFFLIQSFAGPYDPWRGRHFISCAILATPVVLMLLKSTSKYVRYYSAVIILLGCVSALSSVVFHSVRPALTVSYNGSSGLQMSAFPLLHRDRLSQLTVNRRKYIYVLRLYERMVPEDAIVAISVPWGSWEYPLFGPGLTRIIHPIRSFDGRDHPIPSTAQFFLFDSTIVRPLDDDLSLGESWFLRTLKKHRCNEKRFSKMEEYHTRR